MSILKTPDLDSRLAAFEALYRRVFDDVYAYAWTILRDDVATEEALAVAFERAYRRWDSFDEKRGVRRAWLFGIVRNATLDELRRMQRQHRLIEAAQTELACREKNSTDFDSQVASRVGLRQALQHLSGAERELIALKFYADCSNQEIAEITETSVSNVGTRLSRIITKLREVAL